MSEKKENENTREFQNSTTRLGCATSCLAEHERYRFDTVYVHCTASMIPAKRYANHKFSRNQKKFYTNLTRVDHYLSIIICVLRWTKTKAIGYHSLFITKLRRKMEFETVHTEQYDERRMRVFFLKNLWEDYPLTHSFLDDV